MILTAGSMSLGPAGANRENVHSGEGCMNAVEIEEAIIAAGQAFDPAAPRTGNV